MKRRPLDFTAKNSVQKSAWKDNAKDRDNDFPKGTYYKAKQRPMRGLESKPRKNAFDKRFKLKEMK